MAKLLAARCYRALSPPAFPKLLQSRFDGGFERRQIVLNRQPHASDVDSVVFAPQEIPYAAQLGPGNSVMDPKMWTQKWPFLKWWAALKMKESQCHERGRITRPA
jgi:hypothetical protein